MIESACHCGNVKLKIDAEVPENLLSCNCSVCHRYGSLMAYFPEGKVKVDAAPDATIRYTWGDKMLAFVHCKTCGCYSHWEGLPPKESDRMGVNARLFTNVKIDELPLRRFDGADTWKFLD